MFDWLKPHSCKQCAQLLAEVQALRAQLSTIGENIMATLADLAAQVAQVQTVNASAIALLQGLKTALDAAIASGDPAQLQALSDALAKDNADLAAAVTANTPASTP